eukprot:6181435-Pyramimonas_sp.AAC.1
MGSGIDTSFQAVHGHQVAYIGPAMSSSRCRDIGGPRFFGRSRNRGCELRLALERLQRFQTTSEARQGTCAFD